MITLNVVLFVAILVAALIIGAALSAHVYGVHSQQSGIVNRCLRDSAVNDEADNGEAR